MDLYTIREELKVKRLEDIPLRVTYYARVSTDKYEQQNSLENQISFFEDMIKNNVNWTFIEGYVDEAVSGKSTYKRDNFLRMISDGKAKKFDLILTKEVSRFARDTIDSIQNTRELLAVGVGVNFFNDNINTLLPDSELRLTIMASMAQDEVRRISERVKFGYQKSINRGRVLGNDCIYGYEKDNCKLVIVEEEARLVRRAYEIYSTGKYGFHTVSRMLYNEGYASRTGKPLAYTTIKGILTNPKYKGYYCGNKSTIVDYKLKTIVRKKEEDWVMFKDYEAVPPIVSEELWEMANKVYKMRSAKTSHVDKKIYQNRYTFSGKIKCACHNRSFHRKVYTYKTKDDEVVWLCPYNNMKKEDKCATPVLYEKELIEILRNELTEFINKKESIVYTLTQLYRENIKLRDFDKEIKKLNNDIEKVKRKKQKLLSHNINEIITDRDFKEQNDLCNKEIENIEKEIQGIKEEEEKANNVEEEINKLETLIESKIKQPSDEMILDLLDKIEVYSINEDKTGVKLKIYLKVGNEIEVDYSNNKSRHFYNHYAHDSSRC